MRTIHRDIVGAFIFSADGKLLLGQNRSGGVYRGRMVPPGGGVEEGETLEQALIREVSEETAIGIDDASVERLHPDLTGQSPKVLRETGEEVIVDMTFHDFKIVLPLNASDVQFSDDDDFTAMQWLAPDEIDRYDYSPATTERLKDIGLL